MQTAPLGPVAGAFYLDNSRVAVIEGPVGSGKSVTSCLRLGRHAYEQAVGPDGVARTRWAIVRNTKRQLQDTTMQTWGAVFPEATYGRISGGSGPAGAVQTWNFQPRGMTHRIEAEFIFRALDDPDDLANLLSLEVTGFWFNEVREIAPEIIAHAPARCRYLGGERGHTWSGWIGDTNSWDTDHWLQDRLVTNPRNGWKHFLQAGGMEEDAENLPNLEQTTETLALPFDHPKRRAQGRKYYERLLTDMTAEDAHVYVHAQRGRTREGKPIYVEYNDRIHCRPFELTSLAPLRIGLDFGRTPAACIGQMLQGGSWRIRHELCAFDMGLRKFGEELRRFLSEKCAGWTVEEITGDPSGIAEDANDETAFQLLSAVGVDARPASTNEPSIRFDAVNNAFRRLVNGQPALIIHPDCKTLRRACIDGYHFRKLKVVGERYDVKPHKNQWSHIAEALQYLLLGGGEGRAAIRKPTRPGPRQMVALGVDTDSRY